MMNYLMPSMSFIDDLFSIPRLSVQEVNSSMKTDIKEEDGKYLVTIDLPGFSKDDVKISLKDGKITIKAEMNKEENKKEEHYICRERRTVSGSRQFNFGKNLKPEDINAKFKDGVLHLEVKKGKEEREEEKHIEIE